MVVMGHAPQMLEANVRAALASLTPIPPVAFQQPCGLSLCELIRSLEINALGVVENPMGLMPMGLLANQTGTV
jgi:hypothetical protein